METLLKQIKTEMDSLMRTESAHDPSTINKPPYQSLSSSYSHSLYSKDGVEQYLNSDMKMLIETYEKCTKRLNELNEKSTLKGSSISALSLLITIITTNKLNK